MAKKPVIPTNVRLSDIIDLAERLGCAVEIRLIDKGTGQQSRRLLEADSWPRCSVCRTTLTGSDLNWCTTCKRPDYQATHTKTSL